MKHTQKWFAVLLTLVLAFSLTAAPAGAATVVDSGSCGESVT